MIFPTWSQNTIETKAIFTDTNVFKKQPEQLEFDFGNMIKVGFDSETDAAFAKLLQKLSKKISPLKNSTSSSLTLQELINKEQEFINKEVSIPYTLFAKSDSTQLLYSEEVEVQNYCNYYGINPHNVRSIKVEIEQGTFIHKVTIEKEIF